MSRRQDVDIARQLSGAATPEERRAFAARLAAEPGLARAFGRRSRLWEDLELAPTAPAPPGFAARVAARARATANGGAAPLPAWARAAAGAALVAGCLAGIGLGSLVATPAGGSAAGADGTSAGVWDDEESLAAAYLEATAADDAPVGSGEESPR